MQPTCLLVEDNAFVVAAVKPMLQRAGYKVLIAICAEEALEHLARPDVDVDLMLSAVLLPGCTRGPELAQTALLRRPGLKILLMTTLLADTVQLDGQRVSWPVLQKPGDIQLPVLLDRIREVGGAAAQPA